MRTFRLSKLVRDGIIEDTIAEGGVVQPRKLTGLALRIALIEKIVEEAKEINPDNVSAKEIGDLLDVIDELVHQAKLVDSTISAARVDRKKKMGGFTNGDYVEIVSLPDDNKWTEYYAAQPDKYPEIKD